MELVQGLNVPKSEVALEEASLDRFLKFIGDISNNMADIALRVPWTLLELGMRLIS